MERSKQQTLRMHRAEMEKLTAELERKAGDAREKAVDDAIENLRAEMEDEKQAIIEATLAEMSAKSQAELASEKAKIQAGAVAQNSAQINELKEALENERLKIVALEAAAATAVNMASSVPLRLLKSWRPQRQTGKSTKPKQLYSKIQSLNPFSPPCNPRKRCLFVRNDAITKLTVEYEMKIKHAVDEERKRLHSRECG